MFQNKEYNIKRSIQDYINTIPEAKRRYEEHMREFGYFIGHTFFCLDFAYPLTELLEADIDVYAIEKYCDVLERMWKHGDDQVQDIINVTILPVLSDSPEAWRNLGKYLSDKFIEHINREPPFIDIKDMEDQLYTSITEKLGMTIEEYAERLHKYLEESEITENDNPIPGIPDTAVLTNGEVRFMAKYVTVFEL